MSSPRRGDDPLPWGRWHEREALLDRYEEAWRRGERPALDDSRPARLASLSVLVELVLTDLEFRLKAGEAGRVEEYLQRYPELDADPETFLALAAAEYAFRRRREPALAPEDFGSRFPQQREALLARLQQVVHDRVSVPGYEVLGELGRGGMGIVYKARQLVLDRIVALKMVQAATHAGPKETARFRREASAAARLQHPNIVQIYEVGEHDGRPYLALEYVDGGNLAQQLARALPSARQAAQLVEVVARAMHFAHQKGIIHRDLKPANILLQNDEGRMTNDERMSNDEARSTKAQGIGHSSLGISHSFVIGHWSFVIPKITDFGLAKQMEEVARHTHSGAILGTPAYMAPEQAAGRTRDIGPDTDVYALGAILYECLAGRPPFRADTSLATLQQVLADDPVPPTRLQPGIPTDLETICLKCLHKEGHRRYAGAHDLAEDLRRWQAGEPIHARPVSLWERGVKWARRRPAAAALVAVCVLAVVGVVGASLGFTAYLRQALEQRTQELRREQEGRERETQDRQRQIGRDLYLSETRVASQLCKEGEIEQAFELLSRYRSPAGAEDWRGFEWYHLWQQCDRQRQTLSCRQGELLATAFSPDGKTLATVGSDGTVQLWDLATAAVRGTFLGRPGGRGGCGLFPRRPHACLRRGGEGAVVGCGKEARADHFRA
jgi:serine/threonine protein kinase